MGLTLNTSSSQQDDFDKISENKSFTEMSAEYKKLYQLYLAETSDPLVDNESLSLSESLTLEEFIVRLEWYLYGSGKKVWAMTMMMQVYEEYFQGYIQSSGIWSKVKNKSALLAIDDKFEIITQLLTVLNQESIWIASDVTAGFKFFSGIESLQEATTPTYADIVEQIQNILIDIQKRIVSLDPWKQSDASLVDLAKKTWPLLSLVQWEYWSSVSATSFRDLVSIYDKECQTLVDEDTKYRREEFLWQFDADDAWKNIALKTLQDQFLQDILYSWQLQWITDVSRTEVLHFDDTQYAVEFTVWSSTYAWTMKYDVMTTTKTLEDWQLQKNEIVFANFTTSIGEESKEWNFVVNNDEQPPMYVYVSDIIASKSDNWEWVPLGVSEAPPWITEGGDSNIYSWMTYTTEGDELSFGDIKKSVIEREEQQSLTLDALPIGHMAELFMKWIFDWSVSIKWKTLEDHMKDWNYFNIVNSWLRLGKWPGMVSGEILDFIDVYFDTHSESSIVMTTSIKSHLAYHLWKRFTELLWQNIDFNNVVGTYEKACKQVDENIEQYTKTLKKASVTSELLWVITAYKESKPIWSLPDSLDSLLVENNWTTIIDTFVESLMNGSDIGTSPPFGMDPELRKTIQSYIPLWRNNKTKSNDGEKQLVSKKNIADTILQVKQWYMSACSMELNRVVMSWFMDAYNDQVTWDWGLTTTNAVVWNYVDIEWVGDWNLSNREIDLIEDVWWFFLEVWLIALSWWLAGIATRWVISLWSRAMISLAARAGKTMTTAQRIHHLYKYWRGVQLFWHGYKWLTAWQKAWRIGMFATEFAIEWVAFHSIRSGLDLWLWRSDVEWFMHELSSVEWHLHSIAMLWVLKGIWQSGATLKSILQSSENQTISAIMKSTLWKSWFSGMTLWAEVLWMRWVDNSVNILFGSSLQWLTGEYALQTIKLILWLRMSHKFSGEFVKKLKKRKQDATAQKIVEAHESGKALDFSIERDFNGTINIFVTVEWAKWKIFYAQRAPKSKVHYEQEIDKWDAALENALTISHADLSYNQIKLIIENWTIQVDGRDISIHKYNSIGEIIPNWFESRKINDQQMDCIWASHLWNPSAKNTWEYYTWELLTKIDIAQWKYKIEWKWSNARVQLDKSWLPTPEEWYEFSSDRRWTLVWNSATSAREKTMDLLPYDLVVDLVKNWICSKSAIERSKWRDMAKRLKELYSEYSFRPIQKRAIEAIIEAFNAGEVSWYLTIPTWVGKSYLYAQIIKMLDIQTMITCPASLMTQTYNNFIDNSWYAPKDILRIQKSGSQSVADVVSEIMSRLESWDYKVILVAPTTLMQIRKQNIDAFNLISRSVELIVKDEAHMQLWETFMETMDILANPQVISNDWFMEMARSMIELIEIHASELDAEWLIEDIYRLMREEQDTGWVDIKSIEGLKNLLKGKGLEDILDSDVPIDFDEIFSWKTQLLFTATPDLIKKWLWDFYHEIFTAKLEEAFKDWTLVKPTQRLSETEAILTLHESELVAWWWMDAIYSKKALNYEVVDSEWRMRLVYELITDDIVKIREENVNARVWSLTYMPTIGFCGSINHARVIAQNWQDKWLRPVVVSSKPLKDKSRAERGSLSEAKKMIMSGEADGILVIGMNTWFDLPTLSIWARYYPSGSPAKLLQSVWRVLRTVTKSHWNKGAEVFLTANEKTLKQEIIDWRVKSELIDKYDSYFQDVQMNFFEFLGANESTQVELEVTFTTEEWVVTTEIRTFTPNEMLLELMKSDVSDQLQNKSTENTFWIEPKRITRVRKVWESQSPLSELWWEKLTSWGGSKWWTLIPLVSTFDLFNESGSSYSDAQIESILLQKNVWILEELLEMNTRSSLLNMTGAQRASFRILYNGHEYTINKIASEVFKNKWLTKPEVFSPSTSSTDRFRFLWVLFGETLILENEVYNYFIEYGGREGLRSGKYSIPKSLKKLKIMWKSIEHIYRYILKKDPAWSVLKNNELAELHRRLSEVVWAKRLELSLSKSKELLNSSKPITLSKSVTISKIDVRRLASLLSNRYVWNKSIDSRKDNQEAFRILRWANQIERWGISIEEQDWSSRKKISAICSHLWIWTDREKFNPVTNVEDWHYALNEIFWQNIEKLTDQQIWEEFVRWLKSQRPAIVSREQLVRMPKPERKDLIIDHYWYTYKIHSVYKSVIWEKAPWWVAFTQTNKHWNKFVEVLRMEYGKVE